VGPRDWSFGTDHFRDAFAQKTAAPLNVSYSESSLAIKFINGEYWGFTQFRQQTDNAAFSEDRLGMNPNNVVIMDRGAIQSGGYEDAVEEGNATTAMNLYNALVAFVSAERFGGTVSDETVTELFETYFAKDNFIDYHVVNTFYNSTDWPQNNVRFYRAITPVNDGNPHNDGRWRFTLHDMDQCANGVVWANGNPWDSNFAGGGRFDKLTNPEIMPDGDKGPPLNRVLRVFTNRGFVDEFTKRAKAVMDEHFTSAKLVAIHDPWVAGFTPLLDDMYERWAAYSNDDTATARTNNRVNFSQTTGNVRFFLNNRQPIYLQQLNALRQSVGLGNL
jgi:hypothetical protein